MEQAQALVKAAEATRLYAYIVLSLLPGQLAARLPHCHTHFGTGGHLMACDHASKILATVTSAFEQDAKEA